MENRLRIGTGYDIHPLAEGRKLIIGGVEIPFGKGLSGWSDADVLTHAVIEALLGAAALDDIGRHFPPGETRYKDISSLVLLREVGGMLKREGWQASNIDATVIAEQPKLASFISRMCFSLSQALAIEAGQVSVKASTAAGLGPVGRGEAIEAQAIALIKSV